MKNIFLVVKFLFYFWMFLFTSYLLPQSPHRTRLEYPEKTLSLQQATNNLKYPGSVLYPDYFEIRLHRTRSSALPTEKQYLDNVLTALFVDYLSLIRESTIENPQPLAIAYPYPSNGLEDFRFSFEKANTRDMVFPIKIREIESNITLTKVIAGNEHPGKQAFHLIYHLKTGISPDTFQLKIGFFWENRLLYEQSETFRETETLEKVMLIASAIRRRLAPRETGTLSVNGTPQRISVYLNDVFCGKTPLVVENLAPGSYTLILRKEGFQDISTPIIITAQKTTEYQAKLQPPKGIGSIEIITNPAGARIYNGALFSGTTPTKLEGLPPGTVRLHLAMNGYVDEFRNFTITEEKPHHLWRLNLREGSPQDFYRPEAAVVGPFTWHDFFLGSVFLAGGFTASAIYFAVQRDNTRDEMLVRLSTSNPTFFTAADKKLYREKTAEMNRYANYSSVSLAAAGISLVFAFYSFYRHILTTDAQFANKNYLPEEHFGLQATLHNEGWIVNAGYRF